MKTAHEGEEGQLSAEGGRRAGTGPEPASERLKAEIAGGALEIQTEADDPKQADADRAAAEGEMGAFFDRLRTREATPRTPPRG